MRVIRNPTIRTDLLRANEWVFAQCEERRRRTQPRLPISRLQYGASCEPRRHGDRCRVHHERISALVWVQLVVFVPTIILLGTGADIGHLRKRAEALMGKLILLPDFANFSTMFLLEPPVLDELVESVIEPVSDMAVGSPWRA